MRHERTPLLTIKKQAKQMPNYGESNVCDNAAKARDTAAVANQNRPPLVEERPASWL
jgi:hypothetical protein